MKLRILSIILGPSILWLLLFVIKKAFPSFGLSEWVLLGLCLGSLLRPFFIRRKFLSNLILIDSNLEVEYVTQFLQKKQVSISAADILGIEYVRRNWFVEECDHLKIKNQNEWTSYGLLGNEIKSKAKDFLSDLEEISSKNIAIVE